MRGQGDAQRPLVRARAAGGIQRRVGQGAFQCAGQVLRAGEQRGGVAVVAHTQRHQARRLAVLRLQVGGVHAFRKRLADAHQRIEMRTFGALEQILAHQPGIAVAILRRQPALIGQAHFHPVPVHVQFGQRLVHRCRRGAAGQQDAGAAHFVDVVVEGLRHLGGHRLDPAIGIAVLDELDAVVVEGGGAHAATPGASRSASAA